MPYLFTYGSLMQGQSNHRILQSLNAKFVDNATIQADIVPTKYPFPALKRGLGLARGEVYLVTEDALSRLDMFEGDPEFYQRRQMFTTDGLEVSVYLGTGVIGSRPEPLLGEYNGTS